MNLIAFLWPRNCINTQPCLGLCERALFLGTLPTPCPFFRAGGNTSITKILFTAGDKMLKLKEKYGTNKIVIITISMRITNQKFTFIFWHFEKLLISLFKLQSMSNNRLIKRFYLSCASNFGKFSNRK